MAEPGCEHDDPDLDATDFAHPAWWRGNDYAYHMVCQKIAAVLDGKDDGSGVINGSELETIRRRIMALMEGRHG